MTKQGDNQDSEELASFQVCYVLKSVGIIKKKKKPTSLPPVKMAQALRVGRAEPHFLSALQDNCLENEPAPQGTAQLSSWSANVNKSLVIEGPAFQLEGEAVARFSL